VPTARGARAPHLVVVAPGAKLRPGPSPHPGVALFAVRLRPLDRVVRLAARSNAAARRRAGGIPRRLEPRPHRWLAAAVHDGGNPEFPAAALRFRHCEARPWLRLIGPVPPGLLHPRPVLLAIGRARLARHPLTPRASAMALALFACRQPVGPLHHPCPETCICGRTLGGGLLLGRLARDCPGPPPWACRLPVPRLSPPPVPSPRSGLHRQA